MKANTTYRALFAALVTLAIGICASKALAQESRDEKTVRDLAAGYAQNKVKLGDFKCTFKATYGTAISLEDAQSGKSTKLKSADCEWIRAGDREKFRMTGDVKTMKQAVDKASATGGQMDSPFGFYTELRQNSHRIYFSEIGLNAIFYTMNAEHSRASLTLFSYGALGRGEDKNFPALARNGATPKIAEKGNGEVALSIDDIGLKYQFLIDQKRGFLPTNVAIYLKGTPDLKIMATALEIRKLDSGAFLPWKTRSFSIREGVYHVMEFDVVEFKSDYRPTADDFSFRTALETRVQSEDDRELRTVLSNPMTIRISEVHILEALCQKAKRERE